MMRLMFLLLILSFFSCNKMEPGEVGENVSIRIEPNTTNDDYPTSNKKHYVVRNTDVHENKLLLFIGGSFSTPKNYNTICDHAASIGLDVISLSYPNNVASFPLGESSDSLIFDRYREEICFGTPGSDDVEVDEFNSINVRTINLLRYLDQEYADQNWNQYLIDNNELDWNKIVVAGHSQGAGHASYLAKKNEVNRVAMFSGPNDYSTFYQQAGNWLTEEGATNLDRHFSLLHEEDEVVPFDNQVSNLRGLGLLTLEENPLNADELGSPYENVNALSISISAFNNHSSTVGDNDVLPAIWTYMLLD